MAAAQGTRLGTGYIDVEPDFSRFQEVIGRRLNQALAPAARRAGGSVGKEMAKGIDSGGLGRSLRPLLRRFDKFGDDAGKRIAAKIGRGAQKSRGDMFGLAEAIGEVEKESRKAGRTAKRMEGDMFGVGKAAKRLGRDLRSVKTQLNDWHTEARKADGGARRLGARLRSVGYEIGSLTRGVRTSSGGFSGFDGVMSRVNRSFAFFRNIMRTLKWPLLISGLGLAVQGLSALAAGAVATTAALGPLVGALVALPAAAAAAAQAFGTLKLATAGVGDAIKAALDVEVSGGEQAVDVMRQQEDAAERVADAKRNLALTQRQASSATDDFKRAQEEARRELQDLRFAAEGADESIQGAAIGLRRAKQELQRTLSDPKSSLLDVREAELAVDNAENDLQRIRVEANRAREDYRKAREAGVKGMPQVVAAKRAEEDASRSVADAERDLERAVKDNTAAMKEQGAAASALQEKMAQLPPAAQKFVRFIVALKPRLDALRETAAAGLFPGVEKGIRGSLRNFGVLQRIVGKTATALGRITAKAGQRLGSEVWGRDLSRLGDLNARIIDRMGDSALNLGDALRHILAAAEPFLDWLSASTEKFTGWIEAESAAGRESGRLAAFFDRTRQTMERLGPILKGVGGGLLNLGKAARPLGNQILDALGKSAEGWRRWTGSVEGQNELRKYFSDAKPAIFEMGRLLRDVTKAFFELGAQPGVAKLLRQVRTKLVPALTELIGTLTGAFGEAMIGALTNIVRLLGELAHANGPLVVVVRTIGFLAGAFADLLRNNPALHALTTGMVAFVGALKVGTMLAAVTGLSRLSRAMTSAAAASKALAAGQALSTVATQHGIMATLAGRLGKGAAGSTAMSFGRFLGPALGALGLANIISSATKGDWEKSGIEAGGALLGGVAGAVIGKNPALAAAGAGLGSMLGGAISGLFSSSERLVPIQERLQQLGERSAKAMRQQANAADSLVAAQGRLRNSSQREKAASQAVAEAQRRHTAAVRNFGPESLPALKAALALARAQRREAKAAEEAKEAHKLTGLQLKLYRSRAVEAVHIETQRIPLLKQTVTRLQKQWEGERGNDQLRDRLSKKLNELTESERRRNRVIKEAAQVAGPKFAQSLQRQTALQATFGKHLQGLVRQLPTFGQASQRVTRDVTKDWGVAGLSGVIQRFKRRTQTDVEQGASSDLKTFGQKGSRSFHSLAEVVREAQQNILDNTRKASGVLGGAKVKSFSLKKMGGGDKPVERQRGGPVPTQLATGGLAATVPGNSTGDRHLLSLNGMPVAKVESKEGIFVGNRNLMGALHSANEAIPRFQTGGLLKGFNVDGAKPGFVPFMNYMNSLFGPIYVMSGLRPGSITTSGRPSNHSTGNAVDISTTQNGLNFASDEASLNATGPAASRMDALHRHMSRYIKLPGDFLWRTDTGGNHWNHIHRGITSAHADNPQLMASYLSKLPKGGAFGALRKAILEGPSGALKELGQGAIDLVYKAANAYLQRRMGTPMFGAGRLSHGHRYEGNLGKGAIANLWRDTNNFGDANLMSAIAMAESGGDPKVTNSIGARGLYQIIPSTADAFGLNYSQLTDAAYNTFGAGKILKGQGLGAWEAYTNGAYQRFMQLGGLLKLPGLARGGRLLLQALQRGGGVKGPWAGSRIDKTYPRSDGYSGASLPHYVAAALGEWAGLPGVTMSQIGMSENGRRPGTDVADPPGRSFGWLAIHQQSNPGVTSAEMRNPILNVLQAKKIVGGGSPNANIWHATKYVQGYNLHYQGDPLAIARHLGGKGSAAEGASGKTNEKVPPTYRGAKAASELHLGPLPKDSKTAEQQIRKLREMAGTYRAAKRHAEKNGKPETAAAIGRNLAKIEDRIRALSNLRVQLRVKEVRKRLGKRLRRAFGRFETFDKIIEGSQLAYERSSQDAEQIVALEPVMEELPSTATDKQRYETEVAWVEALKGYVNTREHPAFGAVLDRVAGWRNNILRAQLFGFAQGEYGFGANQPSVTHSQNAWENQVFNVRSRMQTINDFTAEVAKRIANFRENNPGKAYPDWLRAMIDSRDKLRQRLPILREKNTQLTGALERARELFFPGGDHRIKPPAIPLAGTGSLEDTLRDVQGIHQYPEQHELLTAGQIGGVRVPGRFGGIIWDLQETIEGLGLKIKQAVNGLGSPPEPDESERVQLLEEMIRRRAGRDAVGAIQGDIIEEFDRAYPIPKFHEGGTYQGPNAEGLALLRAGERIRTPEQEIEMAEGIRGIGPDGVTVKIEKVIFYNDGTADVEIEGQMRRVAAEEVRREVSGRGLASTNLR